MRKALLTTLAVLIGAVCLAQMPLAGADLPEFSSLREAVGDSSQGWRSLFAGNLDQWRRLGRGGTAMPVTNWEVVGGVSLDPQDSSRLTRTPISSASAAEASTFVNSVEGKAPDLISVTEFADSELYVEFTVPKGSNAGVCLMGNYEIQIFDSYGKTDLNYDDNGGIYAGMLDGRRVDGKPPSVNVSRPPGEWQSFHIWFRAPRFDAQGKKVENARFLRVEHNGTVIHENFELKRPTRFTPPWPERAKAPLLLQGDHGAVAFRNVYIRDLRTDRP